MVCGIGLRKKGFLADFDRHLDSDRNMDEPSADSTKWSLPANKSIIKGEGQPVLKTIVPVGRFTWI